jgi:hypothetical protein
VGIAQRFNAGLKVLVAILSPVRDERRARISNPFVKFFRPDAGLDRRYTIEDPALKRWAILTPGDIYNPRSFNRATVSRSIR